MTRRPWSTPERIALRRLARDVVAKEVAPNVAALGARRRAAARAAPHVRRRRAARRLLPGGARRRRRRRGRQRPSSPRRSCSAAVRAASSRALFTHGIAVPHLARNGSPELVDRYVRPALAGEQIGALAVTEPGGGSDVAGLRTTAVRDGDDVRRERRQDVHHQRRAGRLRDGRRAHRRSRVRRRLAARRRQGHARLHRRPAARQDGLALLGHRRARLRRRARPGPQPRRRGGLGLRPDHAAVPVRAARARGPGVRHRAALRGPDARRGCRQRETFGRPLSSRQVVAAQGRRDGPAGVDGEGRDARRDGAVA